MKPVLLFLAAFALVGASGCALSGQKQTQQGEIQLPGERPAPNVALAIPPDEWAAPPRTK
jgi:hypothetical protein